MQNFDKLITYKKYLNTLQSLLDSYFEHQSDYICCKKGCSFCCEKGVYPYSQLEFEYLLIGYNALSLDKKQEILNRIAILKEEYNNSDKNEKFLHKCPFLDEDKTCTVYDYRGIICRNFGILQINSEGRVLMPFCQELGLNYSNVYDDENKKFDLKNIEKLGYKHAPKPFPVSRKLLMDNEIFEGEPIDFGESKALIEWL